MPHNNPVAVSKGWMHFGNYIFEWLCSDKSSIDSTKVSGIRQHKSVYLTQAHLQPMWRRRLIVGCQRWPNEVTAQHENSTWKISYHNDVMTEKRFPYYWPLMRSIHQWLVDFPHKGPVMWCFVASLKTILNKQSSCTWHHWNTQDSHATWYSRDIFLIGTHTFILLNLNSLKQLGNTAQ